MKYVITGNSVIRLNETQGTIQNCGNSAIRVSNSEDFTDSLLLHPLNKSTFTEGLYIRAYNEDTQPIEVNVVPFFFANSGGAGGISNKVDKVTNATAGNVATFVTGGGVQDSGHSVATDEEVKDYLDSIFS